jgi:hypothetical protein
MSTYTNHVLMPNYRYYFIATEYFLYGESIIYYFQEIVRVEASFLMPFAIHHRFISYVLYIIGKQKQKQKFDNN